MLACAMAAASHAPVGGGWPPPISSLQRSGCGLTGRGREIVWWRESSGLDKAQKRLKDKMRALSGAPLLLYAGRESPTSRRTVDILCGALQYLFPSL
jgi:hypothetical protein